MVSNNNPDFFQKPSDNNVVPQSPVPDVLPAVLPAATEKCNVKVPLNKPIVQETINLEEVKAPSEVITRFDNGDFRIGEGEGIKRSSPKYVTFCGKLVNNKRVSTTFNITRVTTHIKEDTSTGSLGLIRDYNFLEGIPSNSSTRYYIVDKEKLFNSVGSSEICVSKQKTGHRLTDDEKVRHSLTSNTTQIRNVVTPFDWKVVLKLMADYGLSFNEIVRNWLYEGCVKDKKIVDVWKGLLVPFYGFNPQIIQGFNPHLLVLTNSGTGKSQMAYVTGCTLSVDPTPAGLLGGNLPDYQGQEIGALAGDGLPVVLDELNTKETEIIKSLLTYLDGGEVQRTLKVRVNCSGTKTVVINGNPNTGVSFEKSFARFLKSVCGEECPERNGRRLLPLVGNDFLTVVDTPDTQRSFAFRKTLSNMYDSMLFAAQDKSKAFFSSQLNWARQPMEYEREELKKLSEQIENNRVKDFFKGVGISAHKKVKMLAAKAFFLDNMDIALTQPAARLRSAFETMRDEMAAYYYKITALESAKNILEYSSAESDSKYEDFQKLWKSNNSGAYNRRYSVSECASILGVTARTIHNWITKAGFEKQQPQK